MYLLLKQSIFILLEKKFDDSEKISVAKWHRPFTKGKHAAKQGGVEFSRATNPQVNS